jgi:hypothetical protein
MIQRFPVPILALLGSLLALGPTPTDAQDFQCGIPSLARALDLNGNELKFDSIQPNRDCRGMSESFLMPDTVNFHIYAIPDGDMPRLSMYPDGLVQPRVVGNTLELDIQDIMKGLGKKDGDNVLAAVNVFVPVSQLKSVRVQGVNMNVEVVNTIESTESNSLTVEDSGVDNSVFLTAPYSKILYTGSGVNSRAYMETAAGSSITLSGVDQEVHIKTEGANLSVDMSGVNEKVYVEGGDFDQISMSGVDTRVYTNGGSCNNVDQSGLDNSCRLTTDNVTIPTLECLASSNLQNGCTGAEGLVKAIIWLLVISGLAFLCCCCGCVAGIVYCANAANRRGDNSNNTVATKPAQVQGGGSMENHPYVQEQPEADIPVPNYASHEMIKETVPAVTGLGDSGDGVARIPEAEILSVARIPEAEILSVEDDTAPHAKGDNAV